MRLTLAIMLLLVLGLAIRAEAPQRTFVATAYSLRGKTATGRMTGPGIISADPRVLPLGTKVRIHDSELAGIYIVADTGGHIKGNRLDIWVSSKKKALQFGRRRVTLSKL